MDGMRPLNVSSLLSPAPDNSNHADDRASHPSQFQTDFLTSSSSPYYRFGSARPHDFSPRGSYGRHMVPSVGPVFDDQPSVDHGSPRVPRYPSVDDAEGNHTGDDSDDEDDTEECENLIRDVADRLNLLSNVVAEAHQFSKVRHLIVN